MAVALKTRIFQSPVDLAAFCVAVPNNVTTVVSITFDATSNKYVLFYT